MNLHESHRHLFWRPVQSLAATHFLQRSPLPYLDCADPQDSGVQAPLLPLTPQCAAGARQRADAAAEVARWPLGTVEEAAPGLLWAGRHQSAAMHQIVSVQVRWQCHVRQGCSWPRSIKALLSHTSELRNDAKAVMPETASVCLNSTGMFLSNLVVNVCNRGAEHSGVVTHLAIIISFQI